MMKKLLLSIAITALLGLTQSANASLLKRDFQNPGDGLLITDTATNLEWLAPSITRTHAYNDSFVQSLAATNGFRYATALETSSMLSANFNNPTTAPPGNAAGFQSAQQFFQVFGINEPTRCFDGGVLVACPRTQGLTASSTSAGSHLAFGMIQFGSNGWMISDNVWGDTLTDLQMGSWLVRPAATVAEPSSVALLFAGLVGLLLARAQPWRGRRAGSTARRLAAAITLMAGTLAQASPWQISDLGLLPGNSHVSVRDVNSAGQVTGFAYGADNVLTAFFGDRNGLQDIGAQGVARYGYATSHGLQLNEQGQVVGNASLGTGATRAWRYSDGQMQDLGTLGGSYSSANIINASGLVAGRSYPASSGLMSVFTSDGQTMTSHGNLGGDYLEVAAVNDQGVVVGTANKGTSLSRAYRVTGGQVWEVPTENAGQTHSFATDINNRNDIVGWLAPVNSTTRHAALATGLSGSLLDVHQQVSLGGAHSEATAINDAGDIVGSSSLGNEQQRHAFLLSGTGGPVRDLGTLGGSWSRAADVNALGQVIGDSLQADGTPSWFVYRDGQMFNLQDEVAGLYGPLGEPEVVFATLSDAGHVAGTVITADGSYRGFLLSPVPEPQTAQLMLAGLAMCLGRRSRARWRRVRGSARPWRGAMAGLMAGGLLASTAAQAADAPPWAQVLLQGKIESTLTPASGPLGFDVAAWLGQSYSLTLTLPDAVQQSGQLPVDDVPGAVSANWQMAWIDSALQLGAGERHAGRARSFQGVEVIDNATVPAGLSLGGMPLIAGHSYDHVQVWASELSGRCVHPGIDGVCSGFLNINDDPLGGSNDPIDAMADPTEVWQGLTVEWSHVWDTAEQQGFSGLAFPALQPGGLDLRQGWGSVSILVWQVTSDVSGSPVATVVAEAQGIVQLATLQTLQAVPEPASAALLALGLATLALAGRQWRRPASTPTSS